MFDSGNRYKHSRRNKRPETEGFSWNTGSGTTIPHSSIRSTESLGVHISVQKQQVRDPNDVNLNGSIPVLQLEFIVKSFSGNTSEHLFVLVNCIDAAPLTTGRSLQGLEALAGAPKLHFIGTVNHINAPLLWDLNRARAMRYKIDSEVNFNER